MTLFHSTRSNDHDITSKQAIRKGIADDGGLYVSDALGKETIDLTMLVGKSYQDIAFDVLRIMLSDFSDDELHACIDAAYGDQWNDDRIVPVKQLGDDYVMELFHGPTCAFKDVALQILPQFMACTSPADDIDTNAAAQENNAADVNERVMIVTATSGDTGKAALAGFADVDGTGITVFYPEGKVSQIQQLQMTTQTGNNVAVCAVRGNFDDAQTKVKEIFADRDLATQLRANDDVVLSSANSINVGRLVPQIVYYFSAYMQLVDHEAIKLGDSVEFVVPTGNFGNVLAGYYAKLLGLPVKRLIVASDKNNVLFEFLTTGTYNRQRPFFQTISPSMDILVSSNLERMLYYMSGKDARLITMLMNDLKHWGAYEIPPQMLTEIRSVFDCGWADEDQVREMIADCWKQYNYVIDPHTACGYFVMKHMPRRDDTPRVLLSTASPYKFPRVVDESLGIDAPDTIDDFECMRKLADATGTVPPASLYDLKDAPVRFDNVVDIDQMSEFVAQAANKLVQE